MDEDTGNARETRRTKQMDSGVPLAIMSWVLLFSFLGRLAAALALASVKASAFAFFRLREKWA